MYFMLILRYICIYGNGLEAPSCGFSSIELRAELNIEVGDIPDGECNLEGMQPVKKNLNILQIY